MQEEVGLRLDPETVSFAGIVFRSSRVTNTYQFIFKATVSSDVYKNFVLQASEIDQAVFVSKHEVLEGHREYAPPIIVWANNRPISAYSEQTIDLLATG